MWQVVRDTRDNLMKANLYTDDWPHYKAVVSQETVPRISQVKCRARTEHCAWCSEELCLKEELLQPWKPELHNKLL